MFEDGIRSRILRRDHCGLPRQVLSPMATVLSIDRSKTLERSGQKDTGTFPEITNKAWMDFP